LRLLQRREDRGRRGNGRLDGGEICCCRSRETPQPAPPRKEQCARSPYTGGIHGNRGGRADGAFFVTRSGTLTGVRRFDPRLDKARFIDRQRNENSEGARGCDVEIGAQSMDDRVLEMSFRGHTSADVEGPWSPVEVRGTFENGYSTLMSGRSPGAARGGFESTVDAVIELRPRHGPPPPHPFVFEDTAYAETDTVAGNTPLFPRKKPLSYASTPLFVSLKPESRSSD